MIVLGIESTAHTASVGLVNDGEIIGFKSHTFKPEKGGINPREAAAHHREYFPILLKDLLDSYFINLKDIDKVAYSVGPGLGPSLKVGASIARFISLKYGKIIVPINHGIAHLEIARKFSGFTNPLFLYISGGNTQLISRGNKKYVVLGETMDIGVGNFLDKIARDMGIPFPGAPILEKIAINGKKIFDCPYTVKGMDVSYSGLYTFLKNRMGVESNEDIAFNAQEYAFTALTEIVERGMAHFGFDEFTITGGVARNRRLRDMLSKMAFSRSYKYYFPPDEYLSDNGAMIALAGYYSNERGNIRDMIDQSDRLDNRNAEWIGKAEMRSIEMVGGESFISRQEIFGLDAIVKERVRREYRINEIDRKINISRMKRELSILSALRKMGIMTPLIYYADYDKFRIYMQYIEGKKLSTVLNEERAGEILVNIGRMVGRMHKSGISHGDLTPGNIIVGDGVYVIDPSMGEINAEIENMGVDIHLMKESLKSLGYTSLFRYFLMGYSEFKGSGKIIEKVREIENRRRYV